eukprot:3279073-Pyramimonas_sp.AAC.2
MPESSTRVSSLNLAYDGKDTDYTHYNKGVLIARAIRTWLLAPPNNTKKRQQRTEKKPCFLRLPLFRLVGLILPPTGTALPAGLEDVFSHGQ